MKQLSILTKQDIISILKNGIETFQQPPYIVDGKINDEVPANYTLKMNIFGKLDEIDFLSRLYNLEELESFDRRYPNMKGDIIQHRYNNYDWDDYWFFEDERLKLMEDDEHFLNFIKEIFNPYVREERSNWKLFFDNINDLLKTDGYELYEESKISGRSIYNWKRIESIKKKNDKVINLNMIGQGSYANVYYYKDPDYDKKIVLKRAKKDLTTEEIERFKREFNQLKVLNSPYVVEVYSYNEEENEYTMEFMENTLLDYIQKNNNKLTFQTRVNLVSQFLRALQYIHSKDLLHRDISYTNVLIKEYDSTLILKLSDFGLVKIVNSDLTRTDESIKGSLHDPNLEVVGYANYKVEHEIYSTMFIIHYIMTGKRDFSKCEDTELKKLLLKGIDSDLTKRYKSIEEVNQAFRNYIINKK